MKTFTLRMTLLYLSTLCLAVPLGAEEIRLGVPLPGFSSDPPNTVRAVSAQVTLMGGEVAVVLSVRPTEDAPALLLEGPIFGGSGPSDPYPDRHFPELEFRIDGVAVTPEDNFRAYVGKANVTNLLRTAAVDPWVIARTPPVISTLPANTNLLRGLKSFGAIETSGDATLAKWTAQRVVRLPLRNAVDQRVEWAYRALPSTSELTASQLDTRSREKTYCISPDSLSRVRHSSTADDLLRVTEYSIATGIDGKAPASVMLTRSAAAGTPSDYVFFCGPHGKAVAQKGSVKSETAEVDDAGVLSVMTIAAH